MKILRGDVVICVVQGDYGKPRPAIVVQSNLFNETHASITVCPVTSDIKDASLFRVTVEQSPTNGLQNQSQVMIDKIVSVSRDKIKQVAGKVSVKDLDSIQQALKVWLGH
ncbi:MAG: type II toxin-antitoxin system PemK/MazF family toxin [Myxococcaceae bacterium]